MMEQNEIYTLKTKVISPYEETSKPYPNPKISPLGSHKSQNIPKMQSKSNSELKKPEKIKVVHLHEKTPKHFLSPTPPHQLPIGAPKSQIMTQK